MRAHAHLDRSRLHSRNEPRDMFNTRFIYTVPVCAIGHQRRRCTYDLTHWVARVPKPSTPTTPPPSFSFPNLQSLSPLRNLLYTVPHLFDTRSRNVRRIIPSPRAYLANHFTTPKKTNSILWRWLFSISFRCSPGSRVRGNECCYMSCRPLLGGTAVLLHADRCYIIIVSVVVGVVTNVSMWHLRVCIHRWKSAFTLRFPSSRRLWCWCISWFFKCWGFRCGCNHNLWSRIHGG